MLYDNAQLARLYLWAGIELDRPEFVAVARSTLDYMARDLRSEAGGFYSSEDADSEGVEGKFYVWKPDEMRRVLGEDAEAGISYFGVTEAGNFEGDNILNVVGDEPPPAMESIKEKLLQARSERIRPGLDDKVIAAWNGLAIRALAEAGATLGEGRYLDLATEAAGFAADHLLVEDTLMRSWRNGRTSVPGFLDDHAGLAVGLFTLYSATGEPRWYELAISLVGLFDMFANESGGFYSTRLETAKSLVKRPTDVTDNPLPSGNALAAEALLMASLFTGDEQVRVKAESALASVGMLADRYPSMVGHHLAVAHALSDTKEVAIVGEGWRELSEVYWSEYRPNVVLAPTATGSDFVPLLAGRDPGTETLAYVCRGFTCDLPTSEPQVFASQLSGATRP
jgi:uncharacterized protein YyaL (SSP411 family)